MDFLITAVFSHKACSCWCCIQKQQHHTDATKPSKCDSCLIIQLDINRGMIHQGGGGFLDLKNLSVLLIWLMHSSCIFFSSTSLLNLGGDGSLCTTASSPTDSTGEINNHLFAERLSVFESERKRVRCCKAVEYFDMLKKTL